MTVYQKHLPDTKITLSNWQAPINLLPLQWQDNSSGGLQYISYHRPVKCANTAPNEKPCPTKIAIHNTHLHFKPGQISPIFAIYAHPEIHRLFNCTYTLIKPLRFNAMPVSHDLETVRPPAGRLFPTPSCKLEHT